LATHYSFVRWWIVEAAAGLVNCAVIDGRRPRRSVVQFHHA
jgi:hypothetical protein